MIKIGMFTKLINLLSLHNTNIFVQFLYNILFRITTLKIYVLSARLDQNLYRTNANILIVHNVGFPISEVK